MKRGGPLRRYTRMRRTTAVRAAAPRRAGASRAEIKELDEIARALCLMRQGAKRMLSDSGKPTRSWVGNCAKCFLIRPLQWAHFNSRRFFGTRWDPLNAVGLCGGCHFNFAHHQPAAFSDWYRLHIGEEAFALLAIRLKTPHRIDVRLMLIEKRGEWLALVGEVWHGA